MNIFAGLQKYAQKYDVKESRLFDAEELAIISSAKVVPSQYGLSVCFYMKSGCQQFIPLSTNSVAKVGDVVDVTTCRVLTLDRDGADTINRIEL